MKSRKGFTLVELLAVIAILAILVIIALPNVINLFNNAKRNAFETQVRKVAQVSKQKLLTIGNSQKTFDCNSLLSGKSFEDCTASVEGSTVVIDALGSREYSNYLMVDVTDDGESGTLIDLDKLKEIKVEDEELNETLVKNGKINEPLFKMLTADEYIDLAIKIEGNTPSDTEKEEAKAEYNDMISKITYNNNMISNNKNDRLFYLFKINFTDNMLGKYKIVWYNVGDFAANDDMINNKSIDPEKIFEDYSVNKKEQSLEATINVTKAQNYYFISAIDSGKENLGFEIEKIENNNTLKLAGEKNITIESKQVKDYKDAGIMNNGKKLNSDEYFAYTRLKDAKGTYKYNYIVKTNKGIRKLTRNIKVINETNESCFAYETVDEGELYGTLAVTIEDTTKCKNYLVSNVDNMTEEKATTLCKGDVYYEKYKIVSIQRLIMDNSIAANKYSAAGLSTKYIVVEKVEVADVEKCRNFYNMKGYSEEKSTKKCTRNEEAGFDTLQYDVLRGDIPSYYYEKAGLKVTKRNTNTIISITGYNTSCGTDVVIPSKINGYNVTAINNYAFQTCDWVTSSETDNNEYKVKFLDYKNNDESYIKKMDARCNLERLTSVILPNTLIVIGHSAFYNNELTEVTIPSSVRYIVSEAFYQNKLQNVTFNGNVYNVNIGCDAFRGTNHSDKVNSIPENTCYQ